MQPYIWDLETSTGISYKRKANPLDRANKIIVSAFKGLDEAEVTIQYEREGIPNRQISFPWDDCSVLVGQNHKFDMLYIWADPQFQAWIKNGGTVFDTMVAEYIISGQQAQYASLNSLAEKYGGTVKDDKVKEAWEMGVDTCDIDPSILLPYAEYDIINTEIVYKAQMRELTRAGMLPLFKGYMDHYLATCEMEYNGMYVNKPILMRQLNAKNKDLDDIKAALQALTEPMYARLSKESAKGLIFNPNSPADVSAVLFGTTIGYTINEKILDAKGEVTYYGPTSMKPGEIKTKLARRDDTIDGYAIPWLSTEKISTKEDTLRKLYRANKHPCAATFLSLMLEYRGLQKQISTYLYNKTAKEETGILPLIMPHTECVHQQLNCVDTVTGRLSSKNPNAQNVPKELREMFTSRFGDQGCITESDFSQLEVVVQAYLTQSEKMIRDIADGVDFHCIEEHTEVLTTVGWVKASNIAKNHRLKVFDARGLQESAVLDLWRSPHTSLVRVYGDLSEEIVSRKHNLYIDKALTNIEDLSYEAIQQTRFTYATDTPGRGAPFTDNELRLLIQVITDAHIFKRKETGKVNGIRWKLSKERKLQRLTCLLRDMHIPYKVNACGRAGLNILQPWFIIVYAEWQNWIFEQVGFDKTLPDSFRDLSADQLAIVIEELAHTDGCKKGSLIRWNTAHLKNAELIQEASISAGCPCKISKYTHAKGFATNKDMSAVTFYPIVNDRRYVRIAPAGYGTVIGITSSTDTLITRRNGKVNFTGNCKRLAYAEGMTYEEVFKLVKESPGIWGEKRRAAKTVSFQKAYGAGPEKIAESSGLSKETVEKIFEAEDREYPEVAAFNTAVEDELKRTRVPTDQPLRIKDKDTYPFVYIEGWLNNVFYSKGVGMYQSITGKKYTFHEYGTTSQKLRARGKDVFTYFKNTEIADYAVQGTAADIVAMTVGRVYRYLLQKDLRDNIKIANEVHDSLVMDVKDPAAMQRHLAAIQAIMEDVNGTLTHYLNLGFNVPISVDTKRATSWKGDID